MDSYTKKGRLKNCPIQKKSNSDVKKQRIFSFFLLLLLFKKYFNLN